MSKCHAITELYCTGEFNSMIIKQLKVPKLIALNMTRKTILKVDALAQLVHPRSSRQCVRGSKGIQNDQSETCLKR